MCVLIWVYSGYQMYTQMYMSQVSDSIDSLETMCVLIGVDCGYTCTQHVHKYTNVHVSHQLVLYIQTQMTTVDTLQKRWLRNKQDTPRPGSADFAVDFEKWCVRTCFLAFGYDSSILTCFSVVTTIFRPTPFLSILEHDFWILRFICRSCNWYFQFGRCYFSRVVVLEFCKYDLWSCRFRLVRSHFSSRVFAMFFNPICGVTPISESDPCVSPR